MDDREVFGLNAILDKSVNRSKFHSTDCDVSGTMKVGLVYPIFWTETLPGDNFNIKVSDVLRSLTPISATFGHSEITIEAYWCANKDLLNNVGTYLGDSGVAQPSTNWKTFFGAQVGVTNFPVPASGVNFPRLFIGSASDYLLGGLADWLRIPKPLGSLKVTEVNNPLPFLAYNHIWNSMYRDENSWSPVLLSTVTGSSGTEATRRIAAFTSGGLIANMPSSATHNFAYGKIDCYPAAVYHGYFGSALPWPQRATSGVDLPLGTTAPVVTGSAELSTDASYWIGKPNMKVRETNSGLHVTGNIGVNNGSVLGASGSAPSGYGVTPTNLYTDLSNAADATIQALRVNIARQHYAERLARSGNRYNELIHGLSGVQLLAVEDGRPEYLGGFRAPIAVHQVPATAGGTYGSTGDAALLGEIGGFGYGSTQDYSIVSKGFNDHGIIMIMAVIRNKERYYQGMPRALNRKDRFDYYLEDFAKIGDVGILNSELYYQGLDASTLVPATADGQVFGYQEYASEYKHWEGSVHGQLRPDGNMPYMTLTANFASLPTLAGFLDASRLQSEVNQTLVGGSASGFQFIADFNFDITAVRNMRQHDFPGLRYL